ncbi:hypothetical protein GJ744_011872 [Endocarpon pusillum]|uniref:Uncharacterized protein n=1 Tax=Endocarpon pusillum TaxID=364733 RepID=A0A8H7AF47_9EURO|nr:hypothetical protein GJ744_011872 [Endocarpon pusillum]
MGPNQKGRRVFPERRRQGTSVQSAKEMAFKVSGSSSSSYKYLGESDLNILRRIVCLNRGRSENPPADAIRRPQMPALVLGNEPLYHDLSPIVYARGSYLSDLRLAIEKPGLCVQGSARPFLDSGIPEVDTLVRETRLWDFQEETVTGLKSLLSAHLDTAEIVTRMPSGATASEPWTLWIWHKMRTKEYQAAFRRLSMLAVMVASSMLAQNQDIWSAILVLERGREVLNSLSSLPTRCQRIKYAPHLERQVQELVADLKNPGRERNHEYRRSEFRHLEAFERNSREMLKAVQDLITCERDIAPFGKEHILQQSQAGSIVMLVTATIGAHAVIVTPFTTRAITLNQCSYEDAVNESRAVRLALSQSVQDQSLMEMPTESFVSA